MVDQKRVGTIVFGRSHLRDRNEEEVRGYRDALKRVHELGAKLPVSEATIRELHPLAQRAHDCSAGKSQLFCGLCGEWFLRRAG